MAAVLLLAGLASPAAWAAPIAYVSNTGSNTVSVIDTTDDQVTATVDVGAAPVGVAVSPDGSRVYVASLGSSTVSVIDTANDQVTATVDVGSDPAGVAVSPDGSRVYVANYNGNTASVIDTATNTVTATVTVGTGPWGVTVSPDGSRVYVANTGSNTVSVIDTATNTLAATVNVGTIPQGVAVSPDGSRVYVANSGGNTVSVIDTATNDVVKTVGVGTYPYDVAVSPDGSRVYAANNSSNTVSVIDTATNDVVKTVGVGTDPYGVAVSPDGSRVYVANRGGNTVSVIDTATNAVTATVTVGTAPYSLGNFVGPGALIAKNSSASGSAAEQISGTVPAITNGTSPSCSTNDVIVQQPAHGSVTLTADGAFTYTPDSSSTYSGPDAFTWRGVAPASCTAANAPVDPVSNTATVTLTIYPVLTGLGDTGLGLNTSTSKAFSLTGSTPFTVTATSANAALVGALPSPNCGATASDLSCSLYLISGPTTGTANVTVTATDPYGGQVSKTLTVTVVAPPTLSGLAPVSVTAPAAGQTSFMIGGTGTLTVTATSSNATLLPNSGISGQSACTATGNCTLTLQPAANQMGTATVTVTVADAYGQSTSGHFTLTVNKPAPPTVTGMNNLSVGADQRASEQFTLGGTGTLTVTATSSNTTLLPNSGISGQSACTAAGNCALTLQPAANQTGTATVTVTVADAYGQSTSGHFTLTVNKPAPPTVTGMNNLSVGVGQRASEQFTLGGTDTLTVTATSSNTTLLPNSGISGQSACTAAGNCTLTLQPAANQTGTATVTVTVADAYGQSAHTTFTLTVKAAPAPPPSGGGGGGAISPLGLLGLAGLLALAGWGRRRLHRH